MSTTFITGASKGLGRALALNLLEAGHDVYGIARSCSIDHANYQHIELDLSDSSKVAAFDFPVSSAGEPVNLINNAGVIGDVKRLGQLEDSEIEKVFAVNIISTAILSNKFLRKFTQSVSKRTIVNISSGAARRPVDAWSLYCSSKAGLDMLSQAMDAEQKSTSNNPARIFSLSPGLIDTEMQSYIRESKPEDFKRLDEFIAFEREGKLQSPEFIASKLVRLLNSPSMYQSVLLSLEDL